MSGRLSFIANDASDPCRTSSNSAWRCFMRQWLHSVDAHAGCSYAGWCVEGNHHVGKRCKRRVKGDDARAYVGKSVAVTFSVAQNGAELQITESYPDSGSSCFFSGTTSGTSLSATMSSCTYSELAATSPERCLNGAVRLRIPVSSVISGELSGSQLLVTETSSWRIATTAGATVSVMTQRERLTLSR